MVLLAPAIDFGGNRLRQLGDQGIDEWRRLGWLELFHYGYGEPRRVGFSLYEDAARYDALAVPVRLPTLVVQGQHDDLVDATAVQRWAATRPAIDLRLVDDGHQLTESWPSIWRESARVFGLSEAS
jgi:pimeloyl-ACP methyl ester carboxylesterase